MHRIPLQGGLSSSRARQRPVLLGLIAAASLAAGSVSSQAADVTYDFTTNPTETGEVAFTGNNDQVWRDSGGNTGGFLALTYPQNDQYSHIIFDDIDEGKLVKAFRFEADLRVGNSSGDRAADGFSVSYVRGNDPILSAEDGPTRRNAFATAGAEETGSRTGISVSFDTWSGNALPDSADIEGIIVRVDNKTVNLTALPTRHGTCEDDTSLQTGNRDAAYWSAGGDPRAPESWATLCWQPFFIDLDDTAKLTVSWKGRLILDKFQTTYFPSVGRLVLAGRTGGANEHTHFDNIKLTTVLATDPIVGLPQGDSCGFTIPIADAGTITPNEGTITATLNGAAITPGIRREAPNTHLDFSPATPLLPGSTNIVVINFTTSEGTPQTATREYVVPAGTVIPASAATTQFTASSSGFTMRVHQLETGRGPGDGNFIAVAENQLAGGYYYFDGNQYTNVAELSSATAGIFTVPLINFEQNAGAAGNFTGALPEAAPRQDELIPGIPGTTLSTDNAAAEILTFLELEAGCTVLGFNSDDGFIATLGHSPFGPVLGSFNGGRGASDTLFNILVDQAGVYPVRIAWWEGGGGANLEFFSVTPEGEKILINDPENPNAIKAYSAGTAAGALQSISPANGFGEPSAQGNNAGGRFHGVNPEQPVVVTFRNGLTTLTDASVVLTIDGQTVTPVRAANGPVTTFTYTPTTPWEFDSRHSGSVAYQFGSGTTVTQNFSFRVRGLHAYDVGRDGGFAIEAEHFDYNGGAMVEQVNTMPYEGGEYFDLVGIINEDYFENENQTDAGSIGYRVEDPNVPMNAQQTVPPDLDTDRGAFAVTTNFKIGWTAQNEWTDYTRTFTNGNYHIYAVQSNGEGVELPDRQRLKMSVVGTAGETFFGSYSEPSSGHWDASTMHQLKVGPVPAVVSLDGTQTIRVYHNEGDFDWFILVPTTNEVPAQQFVIEAEDFNFGSGQTLPEASVMPLTSAPYATAAAAVHNVDYHVVNDQQDSLLYRQGETPNVPINENNGRDQNDRGTWTRTQNYKIGWTSGGENAEWFNYTRTFPEGNYNVYAALSHGGGGPTAGSLQLVTGAANVENQTVQQLGTFNVPGGTGGWGNNRLVPMQADGSLATVALSGTQTVRFTMGSDADFDYLVFVPTEGAVTPTRPSITSVTRSGNNLVINWTGTGTLQATEDLGPTANWQPVGGVTGNTATIPIAGADRFFRIVQTP